MKLTNVTGLPAGWTMGFQRDGRERLIVIVKATYVLPKAGADAELAFDQLPLIEADQFTGEPGMTAPRHETDYAHIKPGCDVLLVGSAYAPQGGPATRVEVGLKVGPLSKQFVVVGPRVWRKGPVRITATAPEAFESLPITYDHAFGGTDRTHADRGETSTFLANPVGKGYWRYSEQIDGQPLPYTEQPGQTIDTQDRAYVPMALSPIGRNWLPRRTFAGTYDQNWIETTAPLWPGDFDERYFQAAPPEQTMPHPKGGEEVVIRNLTADGLRTFRLPTWPIPMTFIPHAGRDVTRDAVIDTIVFEPDDERFTMTWRVTFPLGRSVFDVKETIVGKMPAAWHRARRTPGKPYYPSLGAAVEALRRQRGGA